MAELIVDKTEYRIRRAAEFSLVELSRHHAEGFSGYLMPVPDDPESLAGRVRVDDVDLWSSFELWSDERPVAQVLVARRGRRARVASMGVPPDARGQGWGRRALQVAIREAQARGDSLQLEVISTNAAAVRLYERYGFRASRTLFGYEASTADLLTDAPAGEVAEMTVSQAADFIAAHTEDLTWQLAPASLYALGPDWRAWRNDGSVGVGTVRGSSLVLMGVATHEALRRRGHASSLLRSIATRLIGQVEDMRMISIVPASCGDEFMTRMGFRHAELTQQEMFHQPG